jgi:tetratricopeptide (TPR) repeat protein
MSTLKTVNNLGLLYNARGKLDQAEQIFQRALDVYKKALEYDIVLHKRGLML